MMGVPEFEIRQMSKQGMGMMTPAKEKNQGAASTWFQYRTRPE